MPDHHVCCHQPNRGLFRNKLFLVFVFTLVLVLLSYVFPILAAFRKVLLDYLQSIWWAVVLGLFLGGLIDYYVPREYISKILARKSPLTILNAV